MEINWEFLKAVGVGMVLVLLLQITLAWITKNNICLC